MDKLERFIKTLQNTGNELPMKRTKAEDNEPDWDFSRPSSTKKPVAVPGAAGAASSDTPIDPSKGKGRGKEPGKSLKTRRPKPLPLGLTKQAIISYDELSEMISEGTEAKAETKLTVLTWGKFETIHNLAVANQKIPKKDILVDVGRRGVTAADYTEWCKEYSAVQ